MPDFYGFTSNSKRLAIDDGFTYTIQRAKEANSKYFFMKDDSGKLTPFNFNSFSLLNDGDNEPFMDTPSIPTTAIYEASYDYNVRAGRPLMVWYDGTTLSIPRYESAYGSNYTYMQTDTYTLSRPGKPFALIPQRNGCGAAIEGVFSIIPTATSSIAFYEISPLNGVYNTRTAIINIPIAVSTIHCIEVIDSVNSATTIDAILALGVTMAGSGLKLVITCSVRLYFPSYSSTGQAHVVPNLWVSDVLQQPVDKIDIHAKYDRNTFLMVCSSTSGSLGVNGFAAYKMNGSYDIDGPINGISSLYGYRGTKLTCPTNAAITSITKTSANTNLTELIVESSYSYLSFDINTSTNTMNYSPFVPGNSSVQSKMFYENSFIFFYGSTIYTLERVSVSSITTTVDGGNILLPKVSGNNIYLYNQNFTLNYSPSNSIGYGAIAHIKKVRLSLKKGTTEVASYNVANPGNYCYKNYFVNANVFSFILMQTEHTLTFEYTMNDIASTVLTYNFPKVLINCFPVHLISGNFNFNNSVTLNLGYSTSEIATLKANNPNLIFRVSCINNTSGPNLTSDIPLGTSNSIIVNGLIPLTNYTCSVSLVDKTSTNNVANWSTTVTGTTLATYGSIEVCDKTAMMSSASRTATQLFLKLKSGIVNPSGSKFKVYDNISNTLVAFVDINTSGEALVTVPAGTTNSGGIFYKVSAVINGVETATTLVRSAFATCNIVPNVTYNETMDYSGQDFYNFYNLELKDNSPLVYFKIRYGLNYFNINDIVAAKVKIVNTKNQVEVTKDFTKEMLGLDGKVTNFGIKLSGESLSLNTTYKINVSVYDGYLWTAFSESSAINIITAPERFINNYALNVINDSKIGTKVQLLKTSEGIIYEAYVPIEDHTYTFDSVNATATLAYHPTYSFILRQKYVKTNLYLKSIVDDSLVVTNQAETAATFYPEKANCTSFTEGLTQQVDKITGSPISEIKMNFAYNFKPMLDTSQIYFINSNGVTKTALGNIVNNQNDIIDFTFTDDTINNVFGGTVPYDKQITFKNINDSTPFFNPQVEVQISFKIGDRFNSGINQVGIILKPSLGSVIKYYNNASCLSTNIFNPIFNDSSVITLPMKWVLSTPGTNNGFLPKPTINVESIGSNKIFKRLNNTFFKFTLIPTTETTTTLGIIESYYFIVMKVVDRNMVVGVPQTVKSEKLIAKGIVKSSSEQEITIRQTDAIFNSISKDDGVEIYIYSSTKSTNNVCTNGLTYSSIDDSAKNATFYNILGDTFYSKNKVEFMFTIDDLGDITTNPTVENTMIHYLPITNDSMPIFSLNTSKLLEKGFTNIKAGISESNLSEIKDSIYIPKEDFLNKSHQRVFFNFNDGLFAFDVMTYYDTDAAVGFFPNEINFINKDVMKIKLPKQAFIKKIRYEILNKYGDYIYKKNFEGKEIKDEIALLAKEVDLPEDKTFELDIRQFIKENGKMSNDDIYLDDDSYLVRFHIVSDFSGTPKNIEAKLVKMNVRLTNIELSNIKLNLERKTRNNIIKTE